MLDLAFEALLVTSIVLTTITCILIITMFIMPELKVRRLNRRLNNLGNHKHRRKK